MQILAIFYLLQSHFDLPEVTVRKKSFKIILFDQTLKVMENIFQDVGGYDMGYGEFKQLCRKSWEDEYNYLCIDESKTRDSGRYCICNESKNTYTECIPKRIPF